MWVMLNRSPACAACHELSHPVALLPGYKRERCTQFSSDDWERTSEAILMLDSFQLVGADRFALTWTDINRTKTNYRADCSIDILRVHISNILIFSAQSRKNVIIRPKPSRHLLVQLDDLAIWEIERIEDAAFLVFQTSPGNFQAWLAVADANAE